MGPRPDAGVRGWCPDLFTPMQSGDGWLLRLKPRLGRLSATAARSIAGQAARCGNGIIELTGRGNLQLRGLTLRAAEGFARFAVEAGLADPDPAAERRRNILVAPLADADICDVARRLGHALADDDRLSALPGKFGFSVDAGGPLGLDGAAADVALRREQGGWQVRLGPDGAPAAAVDPARTAIALAHLWLASGAARPSRGGAAGPERGRAAIGWLPGPRAFGIGLPFGQMDATILQRLCALSERHGDGVLHLTPWRAIMLSGIAAADPAPLRQAIAELPGGLVIEPDDPVRRVSACIGQAGCASGSVDARADARALIQAGVRVPSLHVSGCAKGCAHPGPAAVTLVGASGRYGLVRAGRAGDTAQTGGLTVPELARRLGGSAGGS